MAWRVAKSLEQLLKEINAAAPNRSKRSDGSIGDAAHQGGGSDHNPNWSNVVCARDFTHDPGNGADMAKISESIRKKHPTDAKYVIFNRRIAGIHTGWAWRSYSGANPHDHHMHVSVGRGSDGASTGPYDGTASWGISGSGSTGNEDVMICRKGDSGQTVEMLQRMLGYAGFPVKTVDGEFGADTSAKLLACRKAAGSSIKSGDYCDGTASAQVHRMVARAEAKAAASGKEGPAGPRGPAGPAGKDGKDGVVLPGTVATVTFK